MLIIVNINNHNLVFKIKNDIFARKKFIKKCILKISIGQKTG